MADSKAAAELPADTPAGDAAREINVLLTLSALIHDYVEERLSPRSSVRVALEFWAGELEGCAGEALAEGLAPGAPLPAQAA